MSVSDPLIKDIKGCVQQFLTLTNSNTPILDNNLYFLHFVQTIEKIFNNGLIRQQNTKFFDRIIDPYSWMSSITKDINIASDLTYKTCVDNSRDRRDTHTNSGRFRLLVKYCLSKKCLHIPVEVLVKSEYISVFYTSDSILGDEILSEICLSVLRQVSKIPFELDLQNASFLDLSWCLPQVVAMELVPCKQLGIAVSFSNNQAVIVNVEPDGVAAESGVIKMGDVLEELNDIKINSNSKGRLSLIMRSNKRQPTRLRIVKAYDRSSGQLYGPIQNLLRDLKIDLDSIRKQYEENSDEPCRLQNHRIYGYEVSYLAKVDVGELGSVKQVQKALRILADTHSPDVQSLMRIDKTASLEIGEIGLKIRSKETGKIILDHPYMKISSCGNIPVLPKIFGYCAGEETCDISKTFFCYIFEATSLDDADLILQSIGQGFHRTHYAV
ncbi:uncharacterized protein [Euwallacea fornicatus]|uniref:uncharacterized protein n=1 Tax=Euwallacea fornicatus TaxID=995702 RepID=UPI00338E092D